jgi:hypothetical protein
VLQTTIKLGFCITILQPDLDFSFGDGAAHYAVEEEPVTTPNEPNELMAALAPIRTPGNSRLLPFDSSHWHLAKKHRQSPVFSPGQSKLPGQASPVRGTRRG